MSEQIESTEDPSYPGEAAPQMRVQFPAGELGAVALHPRMPLGPRVRVEEGQVPPRAAVKQGAGKVAISERTGAPTVVELYRDMLVRETTEGVDPQRVPHVTQLIDERIAQRRAMAVRRTEIMKQHHSVVRELPSEAP